MHKYNPVLQKCQLFAGITETELKVLLDCLNTRQKRYKKNNLIITAGEKTDSVGIVLSGAVHIIREDYWGKRQIMARIESGKVFGESFAGTVIEPIPVTVVAADETEILFINCKRIISLCSSACAFHARLINNLSLLLAEKNVALLQKMEHITQATTREKLLSYLCEQARLAGKKSFQIPFNREELADYLSVERSAMSAELSRMQKDGLIRYRKNWFELL